MASSRWKYTRKNPVPNLTKPIDDPENLLRERKKNNSPSSPLLKIYTYLSEEIVQTIEDLQFEHSLFRSKSDSDLSQVIVDIPTLLTFIPKYFYSISKKNKHLFWNSLCEEIKKKLENIESLRDSYPLYFLLQREIEFFPQDYQAFLSINFPESLKETVDRSDYIPTKVDISCKQHISIVSPFQIFPTVMADRYAPLALPANLHDLAQGYAQRLKQFGAEGGITAQQHLDRFLDFCDLEEVDYEYIKMRLFAQSLAGEFKSGPGHYQ